MESLALIGLADIFRESGKLAEAVSAYETALPRVKQHFTPLSHHYFRALSGFGECLRRAKQFSEAEVALTAAIEGINENYKGGRSKLIKGSSSLSLSLSLLLEGRIHRSFAWLLKDTGRVSEALEMLKEHAIIVTEAAVGKNHPEFHFNRALEAQWTLANNNNDASGASGVSAAIAGEGEGGEVDGPQDVIDEVLDLLDSFEGGKSTFSEDHFYVKTLGGYLEEEKEKLQIGQMGRAERVGSARASTAEAGRKKRGENENEEGEEGEEREERKERKGVEDHGFDPPVNPVKVEVEAEVEVEKLAEEQGQGNAKETKE